VKYEEVLGTGGGEVYRPPITEDSPCYIMYTGGRQGSRRARSRPIVTGSHAQSVIELALDRADVHLMTLPMYHVSLWSLFGHLYRGATTVLMERWDPTEALRLIEAEGVTTTNMVPTMLGDLLTAIESGRSNDCSSLRLLTTAGSAISLGLYERATREFGEIIGTLYGLTETVAGPVTSSLRANLTGR